MRNNHEYSDIKVSWVDQKVFPEERILVIGSAKNPPIQYIDILLKMGYQLILIGDGFDGLEAINVGVHKYEQRIVSYPELPESCAKEFYFSLQGLLEFINMDISLILHFQNNWMPIDRTKSPVPYIYIPSEVWNPRPPFCAHATTYSNVVMRELLEKYHPNIPIIGFLPYPLNYGFNKVPFPTEKPSYVLGFAGNIGRFDVLYKERRDILLTLKKNLGEGFNAHWLPCPELNIPKEGEGSLDVNKYKEMITKSKFGLSIPTILGIPFRDLEVSAMGRCLITKKTRDHDALGFKEGVHYLAYTSVDEIEEYIRHTSDEEAERIAKNAHSLVHGCHTTWYRVPMLEIILEKFGITPHGKMLGVWSSLSVKKSIITVSINDQLIPTKKKTILIGKDIYYPSEDSS